MNPSRDNIEERITALLLGELPAAEAELLRYTISRDAALKQLHAELAATIVLVGEAVKTPADATAENSEPLKLSSDRREKLLAHFKTAPKGEPLFWLKRINIPKVPRVIEVLAVVVIVALLAAMFLPSLAAAKKKSQRMTVLAAARQKALEEQIRQEDEKFAAAPPAASMPSLDRVALKPAPVVVPPPVQIVLPSAEPTTIAGVVNSMPLAGFSGAGGFGGGNRSGGGGGGGGSTLSLRQGLQNIGTFAFDNSDAVRSREGNAPQNFGGEFSKKLEGTGGSSPSIKVPVVTAAMPQGQFPALAQDETPKDVSANSWGMNSSSSQFERQTQRRASPVVTVIKDVDFSVGEQTQVATVAPGQAERFYREPVSDSGVDKVPVVGDVPVAGKLFASSPVGSSALTLSGENAFAGKSSDRDDGTVTVALDDRLARELKTDDVSGVRYLLFTNSGAAKEIDRIQESDARKLHDLEESHKILCAKLVALETDKKIPTTTMVQLTEAAQPNQKQTFWQSLRGEYASTAQMKIESDGGIITGLRSSAAAAVSPYDPYFVQTTFEIIQSSLVLSNVMSQLKLDEKWATENGGQRLSKSAAIERLRSQLELKPVRNTKLIEITATGKRPEEAAKIANAVAESYKNYRANTRQQTTEEEVKALQAIYAEEEKQIQKLKSELAVVAAKRVNNSDRPLPKVTPSSPIPQPEVLCRENNFSTFSLNVSDVSFKLAAASLQRGQLPDAASIRSEEFINAFDYRDAEAAAGQPLAFAAERARYPFAHNRDLLRFSVKTAAAGRPAGRALNLVLLLDNSGSMERADRVAIIREALRVLAGQLQPQDTVSVVTFARTARLWADGVHGNEVDEVFSRVGGITPEGGTNLEEAMRLAYETARKHYQANGMNRVVLLTDGAANLGNVSAAALKEKVEAQRKQGIALDCFGIGFEDYNDDLLEQLSSHGDGRYAFLNSPEDAQKDFASKLAGALQIAAQDVKVQVEFNPQRVISWRQIGYAKHQLTKEQFRDNSVAAGEIAAQEAGNALYTVETKPDGEGPIATVRVRYRVPNTQDYLERSWLVEYDGTAPALEKSSPALRLAATASAFSEWLAASPFAQEVTLDELQKILNGVPQIYGADERPKKLETMLREAKSVAGK